MGLLKVNLSDLYVLGLLHIFSVILYTVSLV